MQRYRSFTHTHTHTHTGLLLAPQLKSRKYNASLNHTLQVLMKPSNHDLNLHKSTKSSWLSPTENSELGHSLCLNLYSVFTIHTPFSALYSQLPNPPGLCHSVTLSLCQSVTLSICHSVNLSLCLGYSWNLVI
jgi:hypothetical protein